MAGTTLTMKRFSPCSLLALAVLGVLCSCRSHPEYDHGHPAKSQDDRVHYLILHYTVLDEAASLKELSEGGVSAHYLVGLGHPPAIYQLVDESRRAFHAGVSEWKGQNNLNYASIGIEVVNRGFTDTPQGRVWAPFPEEQIDALIPLIREIVARHQITPDRVLGHSDIAPQRKQDPGPMFPWKRLAAAGLALWPDEKAVAACRPGFAVRLPDPAWFQRHLALFGYKVPQHGQLDEETRTVVSAFQMRFRPARIDGTPDAETAALLEVLTPTPPASPVPAAPVPAKK